jgi:tRNA(Ile)-lysidine synthase TilS/MesJ
MYMFDLPEKIKRGVGEAVCAYSMIEEGDNVLVGLSGGKDSSLLLIALKHLQRVSPIRFNIEAMIVDPTGGQFDPAGLKDFCESLDVPFTHYAYPIFEIIKIRREKSPCSFCANMRRGILSGIAKDRGFRKIALGHHLTDATVTLMLNIFFSGKLHTLQPKTWQSRTQTWVIRPLIFLPEETLISAASEMDLPERGPKCPYGDDTKRKRINEILKNILEEAPQGEYSTLRALRKTLWAT